MGVDLVPGAFRLQNLKFRSFVVPEKWRTYKISVINQQSTQLLAQFHVAEPQSC